MLLDDDFLPVQDVNDLMDAEPARAEDELGEELEEFDFEFDEEFLQEDDDEWDRHDIVTVDAELGLL